VGGTGRHWEALGGTGRHWEALGGTGWEALGGTGRHRAFGGSWCALAGGASNWLG
jgi:hypothetical protein